MKITRLFNYGVFAGIENGENPLVKSPFYKVGILRVVDDLMEGFAY